jgi:transcriptional regulator with XRE-family HTH domain
MGMKVSELASKAKLSPSQISRIEHHKVSPPLSTLSKIADALGVNVSDFFAKEEESLSIMIHRTTEKYKEVQHGGKTYLVPFFSNIYRMMEPVIFKVPPHTELRKKTHHGGEEYMFVLSGAVDFLYGREVHHLEQHESVYFKSEVPHVTFNMGDKEATVLSVMTSRQNLYNGVMFYRFLQDQGTDDYWAMAATSTQDRAQG